MFAWCVGGMPDAVRFFGLQTSVVGQVVAASLTPARISIRRHPSSGRKARDVAHHPPRLRSRRAVRRITALAQRAESDNGEPGWSGGAGIGLCGRLTHLLRNENVSLLAAMEGGDMNRMRGLAAVTAGATLAIVAASPAHAQPAPPGSEGTPPPATPQGCHGFQTVLFKQLTGDPAQGPAIVAQTQTPAGRGGTLQAFLGVVCGVGSQAP